METKSMVASYSLKWHEEDLYSFLWNSQLIYVRYNQDTGFTRIVSWQDPEVLPDIYKFIEEELKTHIESGDSLWG